MLYRLVRPFLFLLDAEDAHWLTMFLLSMLNKLHLGWIFHKNLSQKPTEIMGLFFPNKVGLAAGLDKNGTHLDSWSNMGFGFIEIGTVTPKPQNGNPKPRMFRLPKHQAIINRMGFNNNGVDQLIDNVRNSKFKGILGINIGKNASTPIERAADDYLICLEKTYPYASYIAVNISSPNTKNLRQLQAENELDALLSALKQRQHELSKQHKKYVPLAVKIAPDLDDEAIVQIARLLVKHKVDAVIATNTTLRREMLLGEALAEQAGGLSGAPLNCISTEFIRKLSVALDGALPIIGVGGILCAQDALDKLAAGASLVQLFSGLVFSGPNLLGDCVSAIAKQDAVLQQTE